MKFKTRIKELRARYDMTQDDLAKSVGVRRETILYLEKGKYNPSLILAHQIARTLKTTIDDLFVFEDEKTRNEQPKNDEKAPVKLNKEGDVKLKEYACIQVNHHKYVPSTIADMQNQGWRLNAYQPTGYGTDIKHYLLFEKGDF